LTDGYFFQNKTGPSIKYEPSLMVR